MRESAPPQAGLSTTEYRDGDPGDRSLRHQRTAAKWFVTQVSQTHCRCRRWSPSAQRASRRTGGLGCDFDLGGADVLEAPQEAQRRCLRRSRLTGPVRNATPLLEIRIPDGTSGAFTYGAEALEGTRMLLQIVDSVAQTIPSTGTSRGIRASRRGHSIIHWHARLCATQQYPEPPRTGAFWRLRRMSRTVGEVLIETLEAKYPQIGALSAMLRAFRNWVARPEVKAILLAMREWAFVDDRLPEYRRRWESEGIPLSVEETRYALHCLMYARFNKQVEPVQYLMDDLGETPREDMIARYIKHAESKALYWDALEAYKESLIQGGRKIPPVLSGWSPKDTKRPDGRGRPLRWIFRDEKLIPESIRKLEGCGLPVTSRNGPSIAAVVADVFGLSRRNVAAIWESAPTRFGKRSRQAHGDQPCRMCRQPSVPIWRAQRGDFWCKRCVPSDE